MDAPRELDRPVCVIRDEDVLGRTNVDVLGPIVYVPSGAVVDADTTDVEVGAEDEE